MKLQPAVRPYWYVDLKWLCGLLFILVFGAGLALSALAKATDENHGPKIAALAVGSGFIRGNTVDTQEARKALAEHGGVITPLPNVPTITITEADLSLTPAEISIKVFKPITDSIYTKGIDATADAYSVSAESKEKFKKDATLLQLATQTTHQKLSNFALVCMILSVVLAAGVIYFSARWGRLANLGALIIVATVLGTTLGFAMTHTYDTTTAGSVTAAIQAEAGHILSQTYSKFTIVGIVLLVAALIGRIYSAAHKPKSEPVAKPAE